MTSVADRTSPVQRGKWIMEVLLGIAAAAAAAERVDCWTTRRPRRRGKLLSTRERMEEHRKSAACASCHRVIDPLGLALENFDVTGQWRIKDNGVAVDSNGDLYDGTKIAGPDGLRRGALAHSEIVLRTFTENLMAYALGRRVESFDQPTIRSIVQRGAEANGNRFSSFVLGIVNSAAFQMSQAERHGRRDHDQAQGDKRTCMFLTKKHISRRAVLKGMGATVALPFLDAMVPARAACARTEAAASKTAARRDRDGARRGGQHGDRRARRTCGRRRRSGRDFDLTPTQPERRSSRSATTSRSSATPTCATPRRSRRRKSAATISDRRAVFLTQSHPKQTQGSDVHAGTSIDQLYAQRFGQDTAIPSMQLCIENVDQAGGCAYGYSCVYTDTISWAAPTRAAADGARSARGVRSTVRRRRDARGARWRTGAPTGASSTGSPAKSPS